MTTTLSRETYDAAILRIFGCPGTPSLRALFERQLDHIPSQVIYNGVTTVAVFPDGKKIKARPDKGAEFDPETGLAMCVAKHVFGSRSKFLKAVEGATNQNKVVAPEAKKYWHELNFIQQKAVTGAEIPTYSQPDWCAMKDALNVWEGCHWLLDGYVRGEGAKACELCKRSKTNKGAK